MPAFKEMKASAYKVEIFIGGHHDEAVRVCTEFCTSVGLCVTVEPTTFCYRGGSCAGVRVGLINYARFRKDSDLIWEQAIELAHLLRYRLVQGSFTVQDKTESYFYTTRPEDGCQPE